MKRLRCRRMLAGVGLLMVTVATTMQAQWAQTSGPSGAAVSDLAADAHERVAVIGDDVYQWENGAWVQVGTLPRVSYESTQRADARMLTLVDGILLAHYRGHLLRSTDYGVTFEEVGAADGVFTDGKAFYTVTDDPTFETRPVLSRSVAGRNFTEIGTMPLFSSTPVALDGMLLTRFGYGTELFRSVDGGENWDTLSPEFPREWRETSAGGSSIGGLVANAHGIYTSLGAEVFHSTDGESWTNISGNLPEPMMITELTANDHYVYVKNQMNEAYSYSLQEDSWSKLDASLVRSVVPTDNGAMVITFTGGIFEFDKGATEAIDINGGLVKTGVTAMGGIGDIVLANAQGLLFRSEDQGESWQRVDAVEGWSQVSFNTNERTGEIYMLDGSSQFGEPLRSTDKGMTWETFGPRYEWDRSLYRADVHTMVATDDAIFAAVSQYGPSKSDGGWRAGGVYRSEDNGLSWRKVDNGLPYNVETTVPIADIIAVDNNLIVTTPAGVFRSDNGGNRWVAAVNGLSPDDLESPGGSLFTIGGTLYLKTLNGFYASADYGKSWEALELELPTGLEYSWNVFSLDGEIYMQSYRPSSDSPVGYFDYYLIKFDGNEWKDVTDWQPEGVVFTDMVRAGDQYFAGTQGDGVWRLSREFSIGSSSVDDRRSAPAGLDLSVAPNPAGGMTGVEVTTGARSLVDISLVDPIGRTLRSIHTGELTSGTRRFELSTGGLSSGTYYVRAITADGRTTIAPVQVVR